MKLVYCWIEDYMNIQNQGFNFGSEFVYSHHFENKVLTITRSPNPQYVPNLFKINDKGFTNISAIVGENGAGKTNFLYFLTKCLAGSNWQGIVLIFETSKSTLVYSQSYEALNETYASLNDMYPESLLSDSFETSSNEELKVSVKIKGFDYILINKEDLSKTSQAIYYSPIYDFDSRFTEINIGNEFVNISSNCLIHSDGLSFHKAADTQRILSFFKRLNAQVRKKEFELKINIPKNIRITFHKSEEINFEKLREPYNLSIDFRSLLNENLGHKSEGKRDIWGSEVDAIREQELKIWKEAINTIPNSLPITRWKAYTFFLRNFLFSIINDANRDNIFLEDRFSRTEKIIGSKSYNQKLDYNKLTPSSKSNFERFFLDLIQNQSTFNKDAILPLLYLTKEIILNAQILNWGAPSGEVSILTDLQSAENLLNTYRAFVKQPTRIINQSFKKNFIDFEWEGLSNGEQAYLKLFARLNAAHIEIQNRTEEYLYQSQQTEYPQTIFLLIDEGEIGFHLQWQKEYILKLIELTPFIFKKETDIQLIFATHSPISLSDLPNEHIVFLTKENGSAIVQNQFDNKSTFSANIHDILRNSFFLQNGFMGSFSQSKIDEVISHLRDDIDTSLSEDYVQKLIVNVDEPILRMKLEELFSAKYYQTDKVIRNIDTRIAYLQRRKEEIRKNGNNKG